MAIDFPDSPTTGDLFTVGNRTWEYDGTAWELQTTAIDPILETLLDAKGDLVVASAADTAARLAVGTNSQFLIADSSETTGLKWSTAGVFTDFSPSCSWSAYGSFDFVRYAEVNGIVFVKFQFVLTGTPSGTFEFDQPIVEDAGTATVGASGSAELIDADGSNVPSFCFMTGTVIRIAVGTGGTVNDTTPFTWASGDQIRGLMIYEAD